MPVTGIWARQSRPGVRGDELLASAARWQRAGTPAAHFADSEATAWAELYRGLAERSLRPDQVFPRDLHRVRIELERVADLGREKARRALGLPRTAPSGAQWWAYQDVGEPLVGQGAQGIRYASAARTRSLCLCVFGGAPGGHRMPSPAPGRGPRLTPWQTGGSRPSPTPPSPPPSPGSES